jgi:hypothetical protein
MKAYILQNSPKGSDHCAGGFYELISEKEDKIYGRWCSSRDFANFDLTRGIEAILKEKGVTEVWSNGFLVWKGMITPNVEKAFLAANEEYERLNSDAR